MPHSPVVAVAWPKDDYLRALECAGARPRVMTPDADPLPGALEGCHAVLLTGGADVDPAFYGETERHPTVRIEPGRDEYEVLLARTALDRGLPVLAICRGVQLLNVVGGGTLFQHLPSERPSSVLHRVPEPATSKVHTVRIAPTSRLAALVGEPADNLPVNSRHHQGIREVAPGFEPVAVAPDGLVEAIEKPGGAFCVGVQWHPENFWRTGEFSGLFEGFVAEARRQAARTSDQPA